MSGVDDLAPLLVPRSTPMLRYGQGRLISWDAETFENIVEWRGTVLTNLPVLAGIDALSFKSGLTVGLLGWDASGDQGVSSWWILGRLVIPVEQADSPPDTPPAPLDFVETYGPVLTASGTSNPNLGSSGEAVGWYHRVGRKITGVARFLFSGTGISAGDGVYLISLPVAADSIVETSNVGAAGSAIGTGYVRDEDTPANNTITSLQIQGGTTDQARMFRIGTNLSVQGNSPFTWAVDDRISVEFSYLADPAALP